MTSSKIGVAGLLFLSACSFSFGVNSSDGETGEEEDLSRSSDDDGEQTSSEGPSVRESEDAGSRETPEGGETEEGGSEADQDESPSDSSDLPSEGESCEANTDCQNPAKAFCSDDGVCVGCDFADDGDALCASQFGDGEDTAPVCNDEGACVECAPGKAQSCEELGQVCHPEDFECVACTNDTECGDEKLCDVDKGLCIECLKDGDCSDPLRPVCELGAGEQQYTCRGCGGHDECDSGGCDIFRGSCISPSNVYWVLNDGGIACDDEGDASEDLPFCSIEKALNASNDAGEGVINLLGDAGPYRENIDISGRVVVRGRDGGVQIEGARIMDWPAIYGSEDSAVYLDGLEISNTTSNGVVFSGSLHMHNVTLEDTGDSAIAAGGWEVESVKLDHVDIRNSGGSGVSLLHVSEVAEIHLSTIEGSSDHGVEATEGSIELLIHDSSIIENGGWGLFFEDAKAHVERSLISGNRSGGISANKGGLAAYSSMVVSNGSRSRRGPGLRLQSGCEATLSYLSILENNNGSRADALICEGDEYDATVRNSILLSEGSSDPAVSCGRAELKNNVASDDLGDSNLEVGAINDDWFIDIASSDFHLGNPPESWASVAEWIEGDPELDFDWEDRTQEDGASHVGADEPH